MLNLFRRKDSPNWKNAFLRQDLEERLQWIKAELEKAFIYVDLVGWQDGVDLPPPSYGTGAFAAMNAGHGRSKENAQRHELAAIYMHTKDLIKIRTEIEEVAIRMPDYVERMTWLNNQSGGFEHLELEYMNEGEFNDELEAIKKRLEERSMNTIISENTAESGRIKLSWNSSNKELYYLLAQLNSIHAPGGTESYLGGLSYDDLALFIKQNFRGFENTTASTIRGALSKIKSNPPKQSRKDGIDSIIRDTEKYAD